MCQTIIVAHDESREGAHRWRRPSNLLSFWSSFENRHNRRGSACFYDIAAILSPSVVDESLEGKRSQLRSLQQSAVKRATAAGVNADTILVEGGEVSGIVRAAPREHADLLVIGLPKHHRLGAFYSTARRGGPYSLTSARAQLERSLIRYMVSEQIRLAIARPHDIS